MPTQTEKLDLNHTDKVYSIFPNLLYHPVEREANLSLGNYSYPN